MPAEDNAKPLTADSFETAKNLRSWIQVEFIPNLLYLDPIKYVWQVMKQELYQSKVLQLKKTGILWEAI